MMKLNLYLFISAVLVGILISSCSELQTNLPVSQETKFHREGINNPHSENFHGNLVRENNWDMRDCQRCHGGGFEGTAFAPTCNNCHIGPSGPATCNTCHGDFANLSRIAPPRDLDKNVTTDARGVGAHANHLYENTIGARTPCGSCHNVPSHLYDENHLNGTEHAEVILKGRSVLFGAHNAVYDYATGSCANTYCHGNFEFHRDSAVAENRFAYISDKIIGANKTVSWTNVGQGEAECGSCHGLPPEGHILVPENSCYSCHQGVVDEFNNIIDITKHINGVANARGN
jgi:predicted CxxxxCH...CXXCH cytochrome family protein